MISTKGGLTMARHAPHILAANREHIQVRRQTLQAWEQRQSQPQSYEAWHQALAAGPQQEQPRNFMAW
jgi:hypothetical protein